MNSMINPLKVISVFLVILLSLPGQAGIRVTANGGGFGEMMALTALARLQSLTLPARQRPDLYELTSSEVELLEYLDRAGHLDTSKAQLEFFTHSNSGEWVRYNEQAPHWLAILSASLYESRHRSKPFSAITPLVFEAWLNRPHVNESLASQGVSAAEISRLGDKVLAQMRIREQRVSLPRTPNSLQVFHIYPHNRSQPLTLIGIEFEQQSLDLTKLIEEQLVCEPEIAQLQNTSSIYFEEPHLLLRSEWRCGSHIYSGLITVNMPKDLNLESLPEKMQVRALNSQVIKQPSCQKMF